MDKLTTHESGLLKKHESVIKAGKNTFVLVGLALTDIRDKRLYRQEHGSFTEYCEKRWGWTRARADQLVQAASVVQGLPSKLHTMVSSERGVRELARVPAEKREAVVTAAASNGPVTARSIKATAKVVMDAEEVHRDGAGYLIPEGCLEFWNRGQEVQDLMTQVLRVKSAIQKARESDDPMYRCVPQAAIDQLDRTYQYLTDAKPYAVCVYCSGREETRLNCRACSGTGLVSKFGYEKRTDAKLRSMREAQIKEHRGIKENGGR